ncbi:MAG: hypothetical protein AB7P04_00185 [Bacteriovoracia bacterium]
MKPTLTQLKNLPNILKIAPQSEFRDTIPCGALTEVSGPLGGGKTEWVLSFLRENRDLTAAWVESDFTLYPCTLEESRIALSRVLFVQPTPARVLATVLTIVRSQVYPAVVLGAAGLGDEIRALDELSLRKLQLAALKSKTILFLLQTTPSPNHWAISRRIRVSRNPRTGAPEVFNLKQPSTTQPPSKGEIAWPA